MNKIKISTSGITLEAELFDTDTATEIYNSLPIEGLANTWGDEIYFEIPVKVQQESGARADVEVGELGYWPVGQAFCVFFGPTPVSVDEKPRAASEVNVFGKVTDDATVLKKVNHGAVVKVEKA